MIRPVTWKTRYAPLDGDQLEKIHAASMTVLQNTGVVMPLADEQYDRLAQAGAMVDRRAKRVRFAEATVMEALALAPSAYTLYGRCGDELPLDGGQGYLSLDGTGLRIKDLNSGQVRDSTYQDLRNAVRVADALPQISFLWPILSAQDQPHAMQPMYEMYAMLENSGKHIQAMTAADPVAARATVEMAQLVAGGAEALRARPIVSNFQSSLSPLSFDQKALEAALIFARAGAPVGFINMQINCATAPATVAGSLVMGNAEILAGIVFLQLMVPGAPVFYGSYATMMELRQGGITSGGPYDCLLQMGAVQLAHHYKLPANVGTFATGAKTSDWQAGVENCLSGAASILTGADMMCGAGLTNAATVFSFEQLLLDCEIYDMLRLTAEGICFDPDAMALEVIERVGPQNHFMTDPHTMSHLRGIWQPSFSNQQTLDQWLDQGSLTPADKAREKALAILMEHEPPPLAQKTELIELLAEYEKRTAARGG